MDLLSTDDLIYTIEHYVRDHNCNHTDFDPESCSVCLAKLQLALYEMGYEPEDYDNVTEVMELEGEPLQDVVDELKDEANKLEKERAMKWFLKGVKEKMRDTEIVNWPLMRNNFRQYWQNERDSDNEIEVTAENETPDDWSITYRKDAYKWYLEGIKDLADRYHIDFIPYDHFFQRFEYHWKNQGEAEQEPIDDPVGKLKYQLHESQKEVVWEWFKYGFLQANPVNRNTAYGNDCLNSLRKIFDKEWDSIVSKDDKSESSPILIHEGNVGTLAKEQARRFYFLGFMRSGKDFNFYEAEVTSDSIISRPEGLPDRYRKKLNISFKHHWKKEMPFLDHSTEPEDLRTDEEKEDNRIYWINFWAQSDKKFSGLELSEIYLEGSHTVRFIFDNGCNISLSVDDITKKHPEITNLDLRHNEKEES